MPSRASRWLLIAFLVMLFIILCVFFARQASAQGTPDLPIDGLPHASSTLPTDMFIFERSGVSKDYKIFASELGASLVPGGSCSASNYMTAFVTGAATCAQPRISDLQNPGLGLFIAASNQAADGVPEWASTTGDIAFSLISGVLNSSVTSIKGFAVDAGTPLDKYLFQYSTSLAEWRGVSNSLTGAAFSSQGTTTTLLHGNASGNMSFTGVNIVDLTATGTPSSSTYYRGDNTWSSVVTSVATGTGLTGGPITTTGTISLANPTASTIGGVESIVAASHKWINAISTSGVPSQTQPDFSDLTSSAACSQLPALTGAVTTSAGSCATLIAASQTITTPVINKPTIGIAGTAGSSHIKTAGTAPTVSCTGTGTGGTSALTNNSTDLNGTILMTAGTSAGTSGVCTLTFNGTYTNNANCLLTLSAGTGSWQPTSTAIISANSPTGPQFAWVNNNNSSLTALTNTSTYGINYLCIEH